MATPKTKQSIGGPGAAVIETSSVTNLERERVFKAFRDWGYLEGDLDPLGVQRPRAHADLQLDSP